MVENPTLTAADAAPRRVAERMGRAETFRLTPVGVFFGERSGDTAGPEAWIPAAHEAVRMLAREIDGFPGGTWLDLFDIPLPRT